MEKIITLLKYIFLAIVQGVGEVLPISSSGHLFVASKLLHINDGGVSLEITLHLASLLALFIYYHKTIFSLIRGFYSYVIKKDKSKIRDFKFVMGMIICLIPTCIFGYFFNDYLDYFLNYSLFIGLFLILNGLNLLLIRKRECTKKIEELSYFSYFKIGIGQCLGLVPGFSRSGSCLTMCSLEKMDKEDSEKFTFLMLFPLVIGSFILNLGSFSFNKDLVILFIISFILTFLITFLSFYLFSKIFKSNKFYYFSYYCFIVGFLIMVFVR